MRIKKLSIKNYRALEGMELEFSENYSTISGKNNAGKSCVIRLFGILFGVEDDSPWSATSYQFDYKEDKTQWVKDDGPIEINYFVSLRQKEDSAFIAFLRQYLQNEQLGENFDLSIKYEINLNDTAATSIVEVDGNQLKPQQGREILRRLRQSKSLYLYNSTLGNDAFFYLQGRKRGFVDFSMSAEEKKRLDISVKSLEKELKKLAKDHVRGLGDIFGRLNEKYEVELTPPEGFFSRRMPLRISLRDNVVDVPLDDWGSGTQNRTRILMAILRAARMKEAVVVDERVTPIVVIEEPESFLHPSAQAEFGRLLRQLSADLGIQLIVTTHSPYMLNQEVPSANILLSRKVVRSRARQTCLIKTDGVGWMEPFAEHLGITNSEFRPLKSLFSAEKSKALLVEGAIDQKYFDFLKTHPFDFDKLNPDIEIAEYGGKSTLKNTTLLQFVLRKFDRVFITYDLDAASEMQDSLKKISNEYFENSLPLGTRGDGKDCIEGLLPAQVIRAVFNRETDLVMALTSGDNNARKKARDQLKKKYLEEFLATNSISQQEVPGLVAAIRKINQFFS
jgi:putative ATP-dependent endonuclease of OLD family